MLVFLCDHTVPVVGLHADIFQPCRRAGLEAKGDYHRVRFQSLLTAGNRLGAATAIRVGLTQLGLYHFHATGLAKVLHHLDGLAVEQELTPSSRAFFTSRREPGIFSSSRR